MVAGLSPYYRQTRTERLIASARLVLAAFSLVAIYLDSYELSRYEQASYSALVAYLAYAALIALLLWTSPTPPARLPIATHAVDLAAFFVLIYFTEGPTSPFFIYFVFALISATLRWHWSGALWTAVIALSGFIGLGVYTGEVLHDPAFQFSRFVMRGVYLAVAAVLLGYLGEHQERLQREISGLASWSVGLSEEASNLVREALEKSALTLGAPRILMTWKQKQDPLEEYLATWPNGQFTSSRGQTSSLQGRIAEALKEKSFLCHDCRSASPSVLYLGPEGFEFWRGVPLEADFQNRFAINGSVLSLLLRGEYLQGRLFFLDKEDLTSDDLTLGEIIASMVTTRMDALSLLKQLQQASAMNERIQLSYRLHNSVLQTLTAVGIQLATVEQLLNGDPQTAKQRLVEIQNILGDEQRNLRSMVGELKGVNMGRSTGDDNPAAQLGELARRLEGQWGRPRRTGVKGL
jgi:signal transduction histidine kinase